jgi:hypothetical protein
MNDADLARRYLELRYRMLECAAAPDHPATKANRARWTRELARVEAACRRRGLFEEQNR